MKIAAVEEYVGGSEDKLHRFVILRKNGAYEIQFEKLVQETLYNGKEYSAYEPIDLEETVVHIFDDYKKAREYGENMLVKLNNK